MLYNLSTYIDFIGNEMSIISSFDNTLQHIIPKINKMIFIVLINNDNLLRRSERYEQRYNGCNLKYHMETRMIPDTNMLIILRYIDG